MSERALDLVKTRSPTAWNRWRRQYNLFGDHVDARIDLAKADLTGKDLRGYVLTNVNFAGAQLTDAQLESCDCTSCSFHLASLVGANLKGVSFRTANLSRVYLRGADLEEADLRGADLRRASLTGASLADSDIRGVDLRSTRGVSQEQLEEAIGDINTLLPGHLVRPNHWTKFIHVPNEKEEDEDGTVPNTLPATVDVSMEMGRLKLAIDSGDAIFTTSFDEDALRTDIIDDIESILPRLSNTGELARAASKYLDGLKRKANVIVIGMRGENLSAQIRRLSQIADGSESLLPDVIGALNGIIIQHYLYVNQSHKWRTFLEEASKSKFASDDLNRSVRHADGLREILATHPNACEPSVADALDAATDEVRHRNSEPKLVIFNLYASINNILRVMTGWAVREFKKGGGKAWSSFKEALATQIGKAGAALVGATTTWFAASHLAERWPEYFGWFKFFVRLIDN